MAEYGWHGLACWLRRIFVATGFLMMPHAPLRAQDGSFEQASVAFIQRYLHEWSGPAPGALAYMDRIYPDQVEFYGQTLTHAALMDVKRTFASRWPERSFRVRPGSVRVSCDPTRLCTVEAVFDWHYRSQEREARSMGSATLRLELQDGMVILSENGSVVPPNGNAGLVGTREKPVAAAAQGSPAEVLAGAGEAGSQTAREMRSPGLPGKAEDLAATRGAGEISQAAGEAQHLAVVDGAGAPASALGMVAVPQREEVGPQRDDIAALRDDYFAHAADKGWVTAWLASRHAFSGEATFVGAKEDQASPGRAGGLRTADFSSAAGSIACLNADNASSLKIGEKVNIHGVITIFIEDVMYLGQCSVGPD